MMDMPGGGVWQSQQPLIISNVDELQRLPMLAKLTMPM
jgi:hypothetical protein